MEYCTNNYLLIKLIKSKNEQQSGLYLPDKALDKPRWGYVLSIGEGLVDIYGNQFKPEFEPGELVYFMKHAPEKVDYSDMGLPEDLYIISEGDVYIKVKVAAEEDVTIIPLGNYILIEPIEESVQKVTPGGIILPDQVVERPTKGKVLAVGQGQRTAGGKYHAPRCRVGDVVRYRAHSTFTISFDDLKVKIPPQYIVAYGDIVGIETKGFKEMIQERLSLIREEDK
jgi:chaperonin GroES